jgi:hypothetical protein
MKTNIGIETTDEERLAMGVTLGTGRMVKRSEVTEAIQRYVKSLIAGQPIEIANYENSGCSNEVEPAANEAVKRTTGVGAEAGGDRSLCEFVPSRGDEDYLYSGEDPELTAACSSVLDGLQLIERHVWATLERNRK